jgi:hypothetical protein
MKINIRISGKDRYLAILLSSSLSTLSPFGRPGVTFQFAAQELERGEYIACIRKKDAVRAAVGVNSVVVLAIRSSNSAQRSRD